MNFLSKNRNLLLFTFAALILLTAIFWPEAKKSGEMQKYYSMPQTQLLSIEYSGEMSLGEKVKAVVQYAIHREENILHPKEPLYRIEIKNLTSSDPKNAQRIAELKGLKTFYASALIRTIVQDWSEPDFYYVLPHEAERDTEYGLNDCRNRLILNFRSRTKQFCIGLATQGDSRRYLLDVEKNKLLITPDFTVRRILNNIFTQREQSLQPYGSEGLDTIEMRVGPDQLKKFPQLKEKTGGTLKLRMLVKDEGKSKINVWHVDGLLSIKPSHAAEFAQLLNALRVNAPFAIDAAKGDQAINDAIKAAGIDSKAQPGLMGAIKLKKTDKQDFQLTPFAFFAPGVTPTVRPPWQFENQQVRPLDTLVVSQFNAGYISADLYPRLTGILIKFENDLAEAQKKGDAIKSEKEIKAKEKKPNEPLKIEKK